MADWSALQPLKNQSIILVIVALVLGAILVFTPRYAFRSFLSTSDVNESLFKVKAEGGLSVRKAPSINSDILLTIPDNAPIVVINNKIAADYISGNSGYWYKVEYHGVMGYAWGKFIKENNSIQ